MTRSKYTFASLLAVLVAVAIAAVVWLNRPDSAASTIAAASSVTRFKLYDVPRSVPPFHFENAAGKTLSLENFRGRVVLINLWATWCAPCRKEMPSLDRLQAKLGGSHFEVVAISQDASGLAAVDKFYHAAAIQHLQRFIDTSGQDLDALKAVGLPTSVLVDGQGREIGYALGAQKWDSPAMIKRLRHVVDPSPAHSS